MNVTILGQHPYWVNMYIYAWSLTLESNLNEIIHISNWTDVVKHCNVLRNARQTYYTHCVAKVKSNPYTLEAQQQSDCLCFYLRNDIIRNKQEKHTGFILMVFRVQRCLYLI